MSEAAPGAARADDGQRTVCANCGAPFVPERRRFCPECGQETHIQAPTLGEFAQQFGGAYFSTEGALWRTLRLLLLKPGELTRQYLAGRRKHYVLPLRLYLTISVLVLLVMRGVAMLSIDGMEVVKVDLRQNEINALSFGDNLRVGMDRGVFFCTGFPDWMCRRMQRRIDVDQKGLQREAGEIGQRMIGNIGFGMFLLLPLVAAALKLLYWNRGLRYTEHLVFTLHLHAFWFLALLLTLLDQRWLTGLATLAIPVHTWLAARRVYGGRWWALLLRSGVLATLYLFALALLVGLVAVWSFVF